MPAGYRSSYEIDKDGNYNIINTRIGSTSLSGKKTWIDDNSADRPEMIKVNLLRNNAVVDTQEVTAENDWEYSFTGLPRYDSNGRVISYSVKEQPVPGYTSTISGTNITNTRSEKTAIEITKGWLDDNSKDRPDSVTVDIYQNDKLFDTVEVTAADDWSYELTDVDAYDENGKAYVYRLEEQPVPGYETRIDGYNITNVRVGKTTINAQKVWTGDREQDRPKSIQIDLLQNGKVIKTVELSKENNWSYQFVDLEEFDEEGLAYLYTVEEQAVKGYTSSIQRKNNDFIITNTLNDEEKIEGEGPEDPTESDKEENIKGEESKDSTESDGSSKGDGHGGTSGSSKGDRHDGTDGDRLPKTGEANNTLLYVIGTLFILVGLGLSRKKFEQ